MGEYGKINPEVAFCRGNIFILEIQYISSYEVQATFLGGRKRLNKEKKCWS